MINCQHFYLTSQNTPQTKTTKIKTDIQNNKQKNMTKKTHKKKQRQRQISKTKTKTKINIKKTANQDQMPKFILQSKNKRVK